MNAGVAARNRADNLISSHQYVAFHPLLLAKIVHAAAQQPTMNDE